MARFLVHGNSMAPALEWGQRLLVSRLAYRIRRPARGDLVVLRHPSRPEMLLVKRIIGVPGDDIRLDGGVLSVGGTAASIARGGLIAGPRWRLRTEEYFVAGERLEASGDSRTFGPVHRSALVGKVWLIYWPPRRPAQGRGSRFANG